MEVVSIACALSARSRQMATSASCVRASGQMRPILSKRCDTCRRYTAIPCSICVPLSCRGSLREIYMGRPDNSKRYRCIRRPLNKATRAICRPVDRDDPDVVGLVVLGFMYHSWRLVSQFLHGRVLCPPVAAPLTTPERKPLPGFLSSAYNGDAKKVTARQAITTLRM